MQPLIGVRAVVTGATSALGSAMADPLLEAGATVAIAARPGPRLEEAVAYQLNRGLAAEALAIDVRDPRSVETAMEPIGEEMLHKSIQAMLAAFGGDEE